MGRAFLSAAVMFALLAAMAGWAPCEQCSTMASSACARAMASAASAESCHRAAAQNPDCSPPDLSCGGCQGEADSFVLGPSWNLEKPVSLPTPLLDDGAAQVRSPAAAGPSFSPGNPSYPGLLSNTIVLRI